MASPNQALTPKQQAIADLAWVRSHLGDQWLTVTQQASPSHLVQQSIKKHQLWWIAGALLVGFFGVRALLPSSKLKNGRDTPVKSAKTKGLLALIASPLLGMARKAALSWLTTQFQLYVQSTVKPEQPQ
jgi:cell division protein FtsW (lipid II flippase)